LCTWRCSTTHLLNQKRRSKADMEGIIHGRNLGWEWDPPPGQVWRVIDPYIHALDPRTSTATVPTAPSRRVSHSCSLLHHLHGIGYSGHRSIYSMPSCICTHRMIIGMLCHGRHCSQRTSRGRAWIPTAILFKRPYPLDHGRTVRYNVLSSALACRPKMVRGCTMIRAARSCREIFLSCSLFFFRWCSLFL
jgi:hypothetical protein